MTVHRLASPRDSVYSGSLQLANFPSYAAYGSTAATPGTSRMFHRLAADASGLRLPYYNHSADPITIAGAVESDEYGLAPCTFNGQAQTVLGRYGMLLSDPVDLAVNGATGIWSRSYVDPGDGVWIPTNQPTKTGEGQNYGGAGTDLTVEGSGTVSQDFGSHVFAPVGVYGIPARGSARPLLAAIFGDSIDRGSNDTNAAGFWLRALNAAPFQTGYPLAGVMQNAVGGEGGAEVPRIGFRLRFALAAGATDALCGYGINDLRGTDLNLAQMKAMMIAVWRQCALRGMRVWQRTILPIGDAAGTPLTSPQKVVRNSLNDWLRAGADANPYLATGGCVEAADAVETSRNSGVPISGAMDSDHVHPDPAGNIAIADAIGPGLLAGMGIA